MFDPMMLREVIRIIIGAGFPKNVELALLYSVLQPIEARVDGFCAALANDFIGNSGGG